jgi:hypothetical protein
VHKHKHKINPFRGKPPKAWEPSLWPVDQQQRTETKDQQLTAEELKYSSNRAWHHPHPTNKMLEVWQNSAIFGGRPISSAVEVLLTKVVSQESSVLPIVVFFVAAAVGLS